MVTISNVVERLKTQHQTTPMYKLATSPYIKLRIFALILSIEICICSGWGGEARGRGLDTVYVFPLAISLVSKACTGLMFVTHH